MEKSLIIEMHYLPGIAWFSQVNRFDLVLIDSNDRYKKQTYRNRSLIRGANKVENLIVPVISRNKDLTVNVAIDYTQKWVNIHRRAITSAYGKSPFFEYFGDELLEAYEQHHEKLIELNLAMARLCLRFLGIKSRLVLDSFDNQEVDGARDLRNMINPKRPETLVQVYKPVPYFQVFGNQFAENLSILDLLFCEGPAALEVLKNSAVALDNFNK